MVRKSDLDGTKESRDGLNSSVEGETLKFDDVEWDKYVFDPQESSGLLANLDYDLKQASTFAKVKDPFRGDMFNPTMIKHQRSVEWWPMNHVVKFLKTLGKYVFRQRYP